MKRSFKLPVPGQRIIRTMIAVWLCFLVYVLRGRQGEPLYAALAVMQCIQPYTKSMRNIGMKRIIGTLTGAVWGLLFLLLEERIPAGAERETLLHYLLLSFFVGLLLYSTVVLKIREAAYFSAVVFLVITIKHADDISPFIYALNRTLDTVIGVLLAGVVNRLHLPRVLQTDTLFVSTLGDTLLGSDKKLSPYSKVELNRLLEDGAKFTVMTDETHATVRELLAGVELRLPVITMDGAVLYDMNTMEYLCTVAMSAEKARRLEAWLKDKGLPFFCNSVEENLLVIRYENLPNPAMRKVFEEKRRSPYRNYVSGPADFDKDILYFYTLDTKERIEAAAAQIGSAPWGSEYRVVTAQTEDPKYSSMKIYDAGATQEAMLKRLEEYMGTKKTVTFGNDEGRFDVVVDSEDRDQMVRELKKRFEPVSVRGWRNIFH